MNTQTGHRSGKRPLVSRIAFGILTTLVLLECSPRGAANTIFFSGNLRTNATVTDCGTGCTLGALNTDGDYAQWTAFENMSLAENGGTGTLTDGFTGLGNLGQRENLNLAFDVILPTNVPEPGAAALFLIGCVALMLGRYTRTNSTNRRII